MSHENKGKMSLFFKNISLLLRCLLGSVSFATLWVGIALSSNAYGVLVIIIGVLAIIISLILNIILPILKLK